MLSGEDVTKLTTLLATKDDMVDLQTSVGDLKDSVRALTNSIDGVETLNMDQNGRR